MRRPTVTRCVPRHDGGHLVVLSDGKSGVSPVPLAIGARAQIVGGKAEKATA